MICYAPYQPGGPWNWEGRGNKPFLVSSVAGAKAERREKGADRENSAEVLKDFASVFT